jgi:hypothetical protein
MPFHQFTGVQGEAVRTRVCRRPSGFFFDRLGIDILKLRGNYIVMLQ